MEIPSQCHSGGREFVHSTMCKGGVDVWIQELQCTPLTGFLTMQWAAFTSRFIKEIKSCLIESDLGVLFDNMSQQCAQWPGGPMAPCPGSRIMQPAGPGQCSPPVLSTASLCLQSWAPRLKRDMETLEHIQQNATRLVNLWKTCLVGNGWGSCVCWVLRRGGSVDLSTLQPHERRVGRGGSHSLLPCLQGKDQRNCPKLRWEIQIR